ncbi:MAG TPA: aconitate hydratase AcnA [Fimbriimonadaceae bacterium]|nr:aconitate hydratase AcnA [Fimbriimonadaceae bacterium]
MNSFNARGALTVDGTTYEIYRLGALRERGLKVDRLPYTLRILLENLLRTEGSGSVFAADIEALANWDPTAEPSKEIAFTPARVLLQDFTGVPCVVDLAAMREAMKALGGDPKKINPLQPVELVIDHSVQVDAYGSDAALMINRDLEFDRNRERYEFLKWGQGAFNNFRAVPPNTGIVHQVNLENLARITFVRDFDDGVRQAYPDTVVGTDSHTTMINGIGVLGWGVGGIEAEAAMLGQPISMLVPQVIGFRLLNRLREGSTATDLVLTVTEMLRKRGVVGKFVEFFGNGLASLTLADRATIGNMSPEFGATCAVFPVDAEALNYMRLTARPEEAIRLTEAYFKEQGLFYEPGSPECAYTDILELDLSSVEPSIAGPKRPQDRLRLSDAAENFRAAYPGEIGHPSANGASDGDAEAAANAAADKVTNGSVVVAAITSCTNTSNPRLMTAAGLVAKKAVEKGLHSKPWVKTSLAPGSRVAGEILSKTGLQEYLNKLNFNSVGYGCTTCIGNSGPLPEAISKAVNEKNLAVVSVLSGNRNFEGRINADVKANYLMSPPLVVAYALAGTIDIDISKDSLGTGNDGKPVFLKDIWPTSDEITQANSAVLKPDLYARNYADVFKGDEKWAAIKTTKSDLFSWDPSSTYVKNPPYFDGMPKGAPDAVSDLHGMRALAVLGDSITTDHISPAGSIKLNSPAGEYLTEHGVPNHMFNSYGSRRGNHEVMVRGTFANIRLRNQLAPGTEGGWTTYLPTNEVTTIYAAAMKYKGTETPLIVIAGKEYGSGSSRDWAAKGTFMLGIKAVLAQSFERIHRSNLVGMGIVPLEFVNGQTAESLELTGHETFDLVGFSSAVRDNFSAGKVLNMRVMAPGSDDKMIEVRVRIDTPQEVQYYRHGGILQYVLRSLL